MVKYGKQNRQNRRAGIGAALLAALALAVIALPEPASGQSDEGAGEPSRVRIALVADPGPAADSLVRRFRREMQALLRPSDSLVVRRPGGRPSTPEAARQAVRQAVAARPAAVVLVGPIAVGAGCEAVRSSGASVPTVALSTGSGVLAAADTSAGERRGCTVVGPMGWPTRTLRSFQRLGAFESVVVAVDARVAEQVPGSRERTHSRARAAGMEARLVPIGEGGAVEQVAASDPGAVFLDHVDRLKPAVVERLADSLIARQIPVFAQDAVYAEEHGALAAPDRVDRMRARRAALVIESALKGTPPPAEGAVGTAAETVPLVVRRPALAALGRELSWDLQVDARLVGPSAPNGPATTLAASMRESIRANLSLQAERQQTDAEANAVDVARSQLLPQVRVSATGTAVSEDVAAASLGSRPERSLTSAVQLRQVLFSEPAFAKLSVEKRLQAMRTFEQESARMDAAEKAATAYLGVLEARAAVEIQRENVTVARTNLRAARSRRAAGKADPREVSRLETRMARAEQGLLRALGRERTAEIRYNRVLDRPLDAPVRLDRTARVDPRPLLADVPYTERLDDPGPADRLRSFWIAEATDEAPEVKAVERLVRARERQLTSANRSFWMPTLSLEGTASSRMLEDGVGTSGPDLPLPGGSGGSGGLPTPPDQQWSVGVTASFPLFNGTERAARQRRASDRLSASKTRRAIAKLGVEQSVRTALVQLETSYEAVQRALEASDAAQRTLDVTQAAYREGTASLVDLIDAQSAALTARQEASTAAYDLMRDWVAVQRAAGSFRALRTAEEQKAFERRLRRFVSGGGTGSP
jgi:outer membrane protein TolC